MARFATALTIAGSDSGGGAGIQADLKTFSALGVYGASAITALTAQNTRGVQAIHNVPSAFVRKQIDSVFSDIQIDAVKIGMLSRADIIVEVADVLVMAKARNIVLDPVMVATSGDRLLDADAIAGLIRHLFPLASIVTPNLPEAAALLDRAEATTEDEMAAQADALLRLGARAVLIKGGHGGGAESVDLLATPAGTMRLSARRIQTRSTHGTGCTLSAAIAAKLAKGMSLEDSARDAKIFLTSAIKGGVTAGIGGGNGPVHHFHGIW